MRQDYSVPDDSRVDSVDIFLRVVFDLDPAAARGSLNEPNAHAKSPLHLFQRGRNVGVDRFRFVLFFVWLLVGADTPFHFSY